MNSLRPHLGHIRITAADMDRLQIVADILDDASRRLLEVGIAQWPLPFPADQVVFPGGGATVYLAWDDEVAAGTFTLQRRDAAYWPEMVEAVSGLEAWGSDGTRPMYLHRLATRAGYRGLGALMVREAERLSRASGANLMRLDCLASSPRIRAYYEAFGYEYRGDIQPPHLTFPAAKYEKAL
jgi:GNAT superfamily N-acetyltransferase